MFSATRFDQAIQEKSEEIEKLLAEQRLAQYIKDYLRINQSMTAVVDPSERMALQEQRNDLKARIETAKISPLQNELSELHQKYLKIVREDLNSSINIRQQIKLLDKKTAKQDKVQLESLLKRIDDQLDMLDEKMHKLRERIKHERESIDGVSETQVNCINYGAIKQSLMNVVKNIESVNSQDGGSLFPKNKSSKIKSVFIPLLINQIENINSPLSLLSFMLLLNVLATKYVGVEKIVAPLRDAVFEALDEHSKAILKNIASLKKDIEELKEQYPGNKAKLNNDSQAAFAEVAKTLAQCFKLVDKKSDATSPSKADYDAVLESFSLSVKSNSKF